MGEKGDLIGSVGLFLLSVITLLWIWIRIVAIVIVSSYISTRLNFNGLLWWSSTILIFSFLLRLLFFKNTLAEDYRSLVDKKIEQDSKDSCLDSTLAHVLAKDNSIITVLQDAYGNYDIRLTFNNGETYIITKDTNSMVEGEFLFIMETDGFNIMNKAFKIDTIEKVERVRNWEG